jgi:hypothetical protein
MLIRGRPISLARWRFLDGAIAELSEIQKG